MGADMQRREFITLVGGGAATWPLAARAQHTDRVRRVGMLLGLAEKDPEAISRVKAFRLGMRDLGWIEGRNLEIEYRFAGTNRESINKNVAELVRLAPDVIVANSTAVMLALQPATSTIPIVFARALISEPRISRRAPRTANLMLRFPHLETTEHSDANNACFAAASLIVNSCFQLRRVMFSARTLLYQPRLLPAARCFSSSTDFHAA
jgi:hypothetical protein